MRVLSRLPFPVAQAMSKSESSTNDHRKRLRANSSVSSSQYPRTLRLRCATTKTDRGRKKSNETKFMILRRSDPVPFLFAFNIHTLWFYDPDEHPVAHENRWTVHGRWLLHWAVRARKATGQCAVDSAEPIAAGCECWHGNVRLKLLSVPCTTTCARHHLSPQSTSARRRTCMPKRWKLRRLGMQAMAAETGTRAPSVLDLHRHRPLPGGYYHSEGKGK